MRFAIDIVKKMCYNLHEKVNTIYSVIWCLSTLIKNKEVMIMAKNIYNIISVIISCALVVFCGYCLNEYFEYRMIENVIYALMSVLSIVIVMTNLVTVGGKKNEKEHI